MRSTELFEKRVALRQARKAAKKAIHTKMDFYRYYLSRQSHGRDEVVL